jgi:UDP-glucose 4-epimerase
MGSELGSLVASLLEAEPWVGQLAGIDVDPPRRRLRKAEFHRIEPHDRQRIVDVVTAFDPHVLVHLAVWEPDARAGTTAARQLTDDAAISIIGAAAECRSLEAIVVRSAIDPTCEFGRMLQRVEGVARDAGQRVGVGVGALRLAPVLGPHVASPLGRLLRQPVVPFSVLADAPFTVLSDADAARAFVAAARLRVARPVNVVAPGAITGLQALLRGRRMPLPMVGPEWAITRQLSHLFGAPIPDHVIELMHRGRLADGSSAHDVLGLSPTQSTAEMIDSLYAWPSVVRIPKTIRAVA